MPFSLLPALLMAGLGVWAVVERRYGEGATFLGLAVLLTAGPVIIPWALEGWKV